MLPLASEYSFLKQICFIESCGEWKPVSEFIEAQFVQRCVAISQDLCETGTRKVRLAHKS